MRERLPGACRSPVRRLTFDLSGVTSCDTQGLGPLVATARRVHLSAGDLRLAAPSRRRGSQRQRADPAPPGPARCRRGRRNHGCRGSATSTRPGRVNSAVRRSGRPG
ncbi:STAS domain-containing protein [Streptomyces sp. NPDC020898]|uniref:STAS domain-containing protein n=1 Tax=Streptomyces sp. NPDC020898 TaxID=3365101 RepID=UPI003797C98B